MAVSDKLQGIIDQVNGLNVIELADRDSTGSEHNVKCQGFGQTRSYFLRQVAGYLQHYRFAAGFADTCCKRVSA